MRYQTKRKVRRVVLIAVLAAIVLGLGGWLIYHFSTPEVPLEERVMTLTADSAQRVTALDDGLLLSSGLTPVSYTHLDVYKRQALYPAAV